MGLILSATLYSFVLQDTTWKAPENAVKKMNPINTSEKSLKLGKKVYDKMCWTCHGSTGKGDGPASASLNPKPADFTSSNFHQQTDGAIFWKIETGRGTMVSYKNTLTENQRWAVINYIRTLRNEK